MPRRHPRSRLALVSVVTPIGLCVLLCARQAQADSLGINILNSTFSTSLTTSRIIVSCDDGENCSSQTVGDNQERSAATALSNALSIPSPELTPGVATDLVWAGGTADLFDVAAQTSTLPVRALEASPFATAGATSVIDFSASSAGPADLQLAFEGAKEWSYSDVVASLTDLTTNDTLWSYGLSYTGAWQNNVPMQRIPDTFQAEAVLALTTMFNPVDVYELTLYARTYADYDSEVMAVSLSGLRAVPEPPLWCLLGVGLVGVVLTRRTSRVDARA